MINILKTERLLLRKINRSDREFIYKQFSDHDVNMYLYDEEPLTSIEGADEIIEFYLSGNQQERWIIELKSTREKIGTCGFHCWDTNENSVEVGYDLNSNYWSQGYMTEAMNALLTYVRECMHVIKVEACISVKNIGSIRLVEKLNFEKNGETNYEFRGEVYPHHLYQLRCEKNK